MDGYVGQYSPSSFIFQAPDSDSQWLPENCHMGTRNPVATSELANPESPVSPPAPSTPAHTHLVYPFIFLTSASLVIVQTSVFMILPLAPHAPNPAESTFQPLTGFFLPLSSRWYCLVKAAVRPPYLNLAFTLESVTLQQTHLIMSLP